MAEHKFHENIKSEIIVLPELKSLVPALHHEELTLLRESISEEGCKEPLLLWDTHSDNRKQYILIDGHNRYGICQELNIDFESKVHKKCGVVIVYWFSTLRLSYQINT